MPKGRRLPAAPVAIADVERAVKQLGGGEPVLRVLKAFLKAMDKRRLNLHEHPASGALLESLVCGVAGGRFFLLAWFSLFSGHCPGARCQRPPLFPWTFCRWTF